MKTFSQQKTVTEVLKLLDGLDYQQAFLVLAQVRTEIELSKLTEEIIGRLAERLAEIAQLDDIS